MSKAVDEYLALIPAFNLASGVDDDEHERLCGILDDMHRNFTAAEREECGERVRAENARGRDWKKSE